MENQNKEIINDIVNQYYSVNESVKVPSIIKCPTALPKKKTNWYVFLAGPIQGAPEWQFDMPEIDGITWLSPRRTSYKDFNYEEQTTWEMTCMNLADVILFWIPEKKEVIEGRDYAQTTRTEFGEYTAKGKKIIMGIHNDFSGRRYFKTKCDVFGIKLHDNVGDCIKELKEYVKECDKDKKIYFTSDTHFGSERTLELSKRPFRSVEEMDMVMIQRWNDTVHPNDEIYHLGDFGNMECLKYLNGYKGFINGNYERADDDKEGLTDRQREKKYLAAGFDWYGNNGCRMVCKDSKGKDLLYNIAHEPLRCIKDINFIRETEPEGENEYFGLFGHIHGRQFIKDFGIDCGVDCNDFRPVSVERIEFFRNAVQKGFYDEEVWCNGQSIPADEGKHKVFLGGTCNNTTWRKELIPELKIDYFNPVVKDWTEEAKKNEEKEKHIWCDLQLYVLTPRMTGTFSIAEVVESAVNSGKRTVLCVLDKDKKGSKEIEFDEGQKRSLDALKNMVRKYGAYVCDSLKDVAKYLNNFDKKQ